MHSELEAVVNDPCHSHYTKISIWAQNYFLRQQCGHSTWYLISHQLWNSRYLPTGQHSTSWT